MGLIPHNISPDELRRLRAARWKGRTDLAWLSRTVLGHKDVDDEVHGPIIKFLQPFSKPPLDVMKRADIIEPGHVEYKLRLDPYEVLPGFRRRLLIDSRGNLKSTLNCVTHTLQIILNFPDIAMAIFQASMTKAQDLLREIKSHLQYNDVFRAIYPDYCPQKRIADFGNRDEFILPNRKMMSRKEPTVRASSIDIGIAGSHFDWMKFSDIVDEDNTRTETEINRIVFNFNSRENLLVRPDGWIDVEGTRYDFQDVYGKIIEKWLLNDGGNYRKRWKVFVRGCFLRDTDNPQFTPEELDLPFKLDPQGKRIATWPSRWSTEKLEELEREDPLIFACTPGWAPILLSNFEERPIKDVQIGDEVFGFDIQQKPRENKRPYTFCSIVKARVLDKGSCEADVYELTMESGQKVYCTEEHLWLRGGKWDRPVLYRPAKVGRLLTMVYRQFAKPESPLEFQDWGWLGGMLDGEGHITEHADIHITQSRQHNPDVWQQIHDVLNRLQIKYGVYERGPNKTPSRNSQGATMFRLLGAFSMKVRLVNCTTAAKARRVATRFWDNGNQLRRVARKRDRIVGMRFHSRETVYWIQTTTGNYVSQGYASKNSQRLNDPTALEEGQVPFPLARMLLIKRSDFQKLPVASHTVTVDTASTTHLRSNFSAITVCAWDRHGRCYVHDIRHGRFQPSDIIRHLFDIYRKYRPQTITIEETDFVLGFRESLGRQQDVMGVYLPLQFVRRDSTISKKDRILRTLQPWYLAQEIRFLDDLPCIEHLKKELQRFPKFNDDILDTLADQFQGKDWFGPTRPRADTVDRAATMQKEQIKESFNRWIDSAFGDPEEETPPPFNIHDRILQKTGGL